MHRSLANSNNDRSLLFLKKDDDGHIGLAIPVLVEKAVVAAIAIPRAGDHAVRENAGSIAALHRKLAAVVIPVRAVVYCGRRSAIKLVLILIAGVIEEARLTRIHANLEVCLEPVFLVLGKECSEILKGGRASLCSHQESFHSVTPGAFVDH